MNDPTVLMKRISCILLIDDSEADNLFHRIIIEESGLCDQIKVAENGERGLEYIRKSFDAGNDDQYPRANLILLDINMPRMNGFEFLEAYRELPEEVKSGIIIAMLTTSLNPADRERALATGEIRDFQIKPLSVEVLGGIAEMFF
tara:strand:+ start:2886 stop:3320 length:435 start_codon:yes stop_codon:yes gene_type:complete